MRTAATTLTQVEPPNPTDLPHPDRCPHCLATLVSDTDHEIRCTAGHLFYRDGLSIFPRPDRMVSG